MRSGFLYTAFIAGFLFSSLSALGQANSDFSIGVSARVVESIEMITERNMQFGQVQPGQQQITIDPLSAFETGKMVAIGIPNARIRVSFLQERVLTNTKTGNTLIFYYQIAGNDRDDQSSAELLQTDNRNLDLNSEGKYYFWIGGRVNIDNAQPGSYNGDFTIEVEYI